MWYKFAQESINIPIPNYATQILVDIANLGGRSLIIGGAVRDAIMGIKPKDIDFEVYKLSYDQLQQILSKYGKTDLVGKSFGVIKFVGPDGSDFDFSLPRTDSKTGISHKDFNVTVNNDLTPDAAAARRDFSINSIGLDPLTGEIVDPFNGRQDLKNKILRHTSNSFSEDALRVLRGMQFSARYGLSLAPETAQLAKSIRHEYNTIPKERVEMEWKKLVQKGIEPGRALEYLYQTGWSENFKAIHDLKDIPQEKEWHPEGTVDVHTGHVMNAAARIATEHNLSPEQREVLVYSALAHDFAKPATTQVMNKKGVDRITSHGHEEAGGPIARKFLESIGVNQRIINQVVPLVENHLSHIHYQNSGESDAFIKQLAERMHPSNIEMLTHLVESDHSGRPPLKPGLPEQAHNLYNRAKSLGIHRGKAPDLLKGEDIVKYTSGQGGKFVGDILKEARSMLLHDKPEMKNRDSALNWLDKRMQRQSGLINGNDVMASIGAKGPEIKKILDKSWIAQKQGEFQDRQSALNWLQQQGSRTI